MPKTYKDLCAEIEEKNKALKQIFDDHRKNGELDMDVKTVEDVRNRNNELTELGKQRDQVKELEDIEEKAKRGIEEGKQSAGGPNWNMGDGQGQHHNPDEGKSIGRLFVESKAFKEFNRNKHDGPAVELDEKSLHERKTVFDTVTGYAPQAVRTNTLVPYAAERPMVQDLIPDGTTNQNSVVYMEETTSTNAADNIAEKGSSPESALGFTEKSSKVEKVSTFIPVTEEAMEDVEQMESIINTRLKFFLDMTKETKLITGNGTTPQLRGMLNVVSSQTQALGGDPIPDAIYKAMTLIRVNAFLAASGIIMHPNDWQGVRLLRTAQGVYIWGNPSEAGPERIWSLPVVQTTAMTENTAIVAAFSTAMQLFRKRGITIQVSNSHDDYFIKGQLAIRADERLAIVYYRPSAICKVTGI